MPCAYAILEDVTSLFAKVIGRKSNGADLDKGPEDNVDLNVNYEG